MSKNVVLKLGGSLMDCVPTLIPNIDAHARNKGLSVLIVPGGAVFADNIRRFQRSSGISDDAAHWMAVLAMEQYGYYLTDRTGTRYIHTLAGEPGVNILMPYRLLQSADHGLDHSWDVTSDTISAWAAHSIGARLVKATDVDGIYLDGELVPRIRAADLAGKGATCVDKGLPSFLSRHNMDCLVVNGRDPHRVLAALDGDTSVGTLILGESKV